MRLIYPSPDDVEIDAQPDLVCVDNKRGQMSVLCLTPAGREWSNRFIVEDDGNIRRVDFGISRPKDLDKTENLTVLDLTN